MRKAPNIRRPKGAVRRAAALSTEHERKSAFLRHNDIHTVKRQR